MLQNLGRLSRTRLVLVTTLITASLALAAAAALGDGGPNIRAQSVEEGQATRLVSTQLRSACLDEAEATALLSSTLGASGDFLVRTDGPFAYPTGEGKAVREHVARGCFVYSGTGADADGRRVYYLSGPDALVAATPGPD